MPPVVVDLALIHSRDPEEGLFFLLLWALTSPPPPPWAEDSRPTRNNKFLRFCIKKVPMWSSYGRQERRIDHTLATHTPPPPPSSLLFFLFLSLVRLFVCRLASRAPIGFHAQFLAINKQDTQTSSTKAKGMTIMNGWMNRWMDEWMDEWMNEWMDEWINKWMDEWMDRWMDGWMNEWMKGFCF
jgi:hypothetical protein